MGPSQNFTISHAYYSDGLMNISVEATNNHTLLTQGGAIQLDWVEIEVQYPVLQEWNLAITSGAVGNVVLTPPGQNERAANSYVILSLDAFMFRGFTNVCTYLILHLRNFFNIKGYELLNSLEGWHVSHSHWEELCRFSLLPFSRCFH